LSGFARSLRRRPVPPAPDLGHLPPLLARVYAARGVSSAAELELRPDRLIPPATMKNIDAAAERVHRAIEAGERILIVGDFDADGATSVAMGLDALRRMGAANVDYLVPNRFEYGYGLTPEIVELAQPRAPRLIITVDNGISSIDGVAAAKARGIDVVVTDHHLPGSRLPEAQVILNPNQEGCPFPSKALAGVGVMFYLLLQLRARLREAGWFAARGIAEPNLATYLDLVALGTVADVVPLDRNNRILVEGGLARMRRGQARPGIAALLSVAGRDPRQLVAADLGFAVGPRLNAAGRLDDMAIGIECLLCEDPQRAREMALVLDSMNRERRRIGQDMEDQALRALEGIEVDRARLPPALVLFNEDWHQGVVGILASRIKERYHRPVIAFADTGEGMLKGSGRGLAGLHLRDLLDRVATENPGLIERFGGHAMAAGLSLPRAHFDAFVEAFCAVTAVAGAAELEPVLETDGALEAADFDLAIAEALRRAGPWGQHFPEPLFDGEFEVLSQRLVGERHLKLSLAYPGVPQPLEAIAFSVDTQRWPDDSARRLSLAYRLDVNEYRGVRRLQLLVEQLEPA
jgi:single-stranded-DNA-specific exonuclease